MYAVTKTTTTTTSTISSSISCIGGVTTLCDGVPRCMKAAATTRTVYETGWDFDISIPPFTTPTPTCTLNDDQCGDLWGAYDSLAATDLDVPMTMPYCSEWQGWGSYIDPCDSCYVTAEAVQLLYWPVEVKSQGVCGNKTGTTITATATIPGQPNTATWQNGTIVTSPSVYLSFASLYARGTKWYPSGLGSGFCGSTARNVMVPVKPEAITSYRGPAGWEAQEDPGHPNVPYSFNFADLNYRVLNDSYSIPLVPKDAYQSMEDCYMGVNCSTIYPGWYKPEIGLKAVEAAFTDVDPKWSKCGFDFLGFYDPPIALTSASFLDAPTPTPDPTPNKASPAPGMTTQQPTKTEDGGSPSPATAHLESSVPAQGPTPQPDHSSGGDSDPNADQGAGSGGSNNGGSNGGSGSDSGGSGQSDPGDGSSGSSGSQGGSNGSSGGGDPGTDSSGSGSGNSDPNGGGSGSDPSGSGSSAIIAGSNGQSITISQLPTPAGGNGGGGSGAKATPGAAFTIVGQGTTISVGGGAATVSGVEISAASGGIATRPAGTADAGSGSNGGSGNGNGGGSGWSTVALTPAAGSDPLAKATEAVITVPGQSTPVTAPQIASGVYVIPASGTNPAITLSEGGKAATVDGAILSAGPSGVIVEGSNGQPITTIAPSVVALATEAVFTPSGESPVSAIEIRPGVFVLPGTDGGPATTISAGGSAVTVDGTVVSAASNGLIVGGKTVPASIVALPTGAESTGIDGYVISALGTGSPTGSTQQFTGGAASVIIERWRYVMLSVCVGVAPFIIAL